jgi:dipeptidyl aminopeptidase/acylaminoacyl peptidase
VKKGILFIFIFISIIARDKLNGQSDTIKNPYNQLLTDLINIDTVNARRGEFLSEIGISPAKDKMLVVETRYKTIFPEYKVSKNAGEIISGNKPDRTGNIANDIAAEYSLWLIDLNSGQAKILAELKDSEFGIHSPSWSPDGRWISFGTFSVGGHSPLTTTHTWIVDSSGGQMQMIKLPDPYGKFSDGVIKWQGDHNIVIEGLQEKYGNNGREQIHTKFLFDCDSKILKRLD